VLLIRQDTGRFQRVRRWVAAAFLVTEKNFRRLQGYRHLWLLKAKRENGVALDVRQAVA
jgi:hypothetical protein